MTHRVLFAKREVHPVEISADRVAKRFDQVLAALVGGELVFPVATAEPNELGVEFGFVVVGGEAGKPYVLAFTSDDRLQERIGQDAMSIQPSLRVVAQVLGLADLVVDPAFDDTVEVPSKTVHSLAKAQLSE